MSTVLAVSRLTVMIGGRPVVLDLDLSCDAGQLLGLVGESGSGKTMTLRAIAGLLPHTSQVAVEGSVTICGEPATHRRPHPRVGYVFQDPLSALNPGFTIGWQLREGLRFRRRDLDRRTREARLLECADLVGLANPRQLFKRYPHELSGGMRQRVLVALVLAAEPALLLADEPTTALDVTISAEILDLIDRLRSDLALAVVLVSHDLNLVATRCDRVEVMYAGRIVESAPALDLFHAPRHPYTHGLLQASLDPFDPLAGTSTPVPGEPGSPALDACAFAPRCRYATERCLSGVPALLGDGTHAAACIRSGVAHDSERIAQCS